MGLPTVNSSFATPPAAGPLSLPSGFPASASKIPYASPFATGPSPFSNTYGYGGGGIPPMIFPAAPAGAPTLLGYRPVYSTDVFTPQAAAPVQETPLLQETAPTPAGASPKAAATATAAEAETAAATEAAATAAPVSYEEELGDRVTTLLQKNPQLTSKIQQWEGDLEAKGLDLETLAENPEQLTQELLANPNSIVNQQLDNFKRTRTYRLINMVYKMVPGPIKKLMIKILPNKYEAMAEQIEDTLFKQPPADIADINDTASETGSASKPVRKKSHGHSSGTAGSSKSRSPLDDTLDKLAGSSDPLKSELTL